MSNKCAIKLFITVMFSAQASHLFSLLAYYSFKIFSYDWMASCTRVVAGSDLVVGCNQSPSRMLCNRRSDCRANIFLVLLGCSGRGHLSLLV